MTPDLSEAVRLRTATEVDDAAIGALLRAGSPGGVMAAVPPGDRYVAEVRGAIVGVAVLERFGGDGLLRAACVDAPWRGQGVGTALVEHVLTEAALVALDSVVLVGGDAAGFFARFGFREVSAGEVPDPVARAWHREGRPANGAIPMLLRLAAP